MYFVLTIKFVYCPDEELFNIILNDLTEYALQHYTHIIHFSHITQNENILINNGYETDDFLYGCSYCIENHDGYYKIINDHVNARKVYHKNTTPK